MQNRKLIWTITSLIGGYIFCQALADVAATKLIEVSGVVIPAGTFVFAATFTLRDILHKRLGKEWAKAAIWIAALLNIFMAIYLQGISKIAAPQYYQYSEEWGAIFAFVPAIVLASIVAELVSELIDTEIYQMWWEAKPNFPQWTRVLISNLVSLPIDSLLFAVLGFLLLPPMFGGDALPTSSLFGIIWGQLLWKGLITIVLLPTIYFVKEKPLLNSLILTEDQNAEL